MASTLHMTAPAALATEERDRILEIRLPPPPREKQTGGKRGPSAPLVSTSDEEEAEAASASSVDYENVNSPGSSSTASEPVYVRPPGFEHHAHEFRRTKVKKKKSSFNIAGNSGKDAFKKQDPTPPRCKPKRGNHMLSMTRHIQFENSKLIYNVNDW